VKHAAANLREGLITENMPPSRTALLNSVQPLPHNNIIRNGIPKKKRFLSCFPQDNVDLRLTHYPVVVTSAATPLT